LRFGKASQSGAERVGQFLATLNLEKISRSTYADSSIHFRAANLDRTSTSDVTSIRVA
jgi:hypothetical protein